jgi:hypothetical protein
MKRTEKEFFFCEEKKTATQNGADTTTQTPVLLRQPSAFH